MARLFSMWGKKGDQATKDNAKAKARVSKRIARSKAPDSPKAGVTSSEPEPPKPVPPPIVWSPPEPVEDPEAPEVQYSETEDSAESEKKEAKLSAAPMTAQEDGRSATVFAQDFVEEFADMVSEDVSKTFDDASEMVEKNNLCCGL
jgi:hypothetical protein